MAALAQLAQRLGLRVLVSSPQSSTAAAAAGCRLQQRWQSAAAAAAGSSIEELQDEIDAINEAFGEARDEIEYAKEDAETVYFNESAEAARKAVYDVLDAWGQVLGKLSEEDRGKLSRAMGLKMEQLKAEVAELDSLHD